MGLCRIARLIVNRHRADPNFRPGAKLLALARVGEKEHDYQAAEEYYKAATQITQVTFADSSTTQYGYDAGDRLTQIIDSVAGTITRTYDGRDRLTSETTPEGSLSYTYDADGRRAMMTVAGQPVVTYAYDDANRVTSITQGTSVVGFTYDDANRRSTLTYPNGIVATYGYDAANQLTSLVYANGATTLGDLGYTYDLAGNRTAVTGSWARTSLPEALSGATYDAANRILTWAGQAYSYDLNGNLASDGLTSYTWNARNQLTGLTGGTSASFQYDGTGRRRGKTISGTTTNFLYDGLNFVQEQSGGGTATANLLTGLGIDETVARTDSVGTSSLLTDVLGSTVALTNTSGAVQTTYTYNPFGETAASGSTTANAAQFTDRENDQQGLYFYRARYYSPALQRFLSEDPLGFVADVALYSYVGNSPLNAIDPLGLIKLPANPSGLGPEWTLDPNHLDPNGSRYRDPSGRPLDWHPGQPGQPGWKGKDHWHDPDNSGKQHLPPGTEVPDPAPFPKQFPGRKDSPDHTQEQRSFCGEHPLVCIAAPIIIPIIILSPELWPLVPVFVP
jgi:RHS repeat-associated protein